MNIINGLRNMYNSAMTTSISQLEEQSFLKSVIEQNRNSREKLRSTLDDLLMTLESKKIKD